MSSDLERLSFYYRKRGNRPRAGLYASLAAEERAINGPETVADIFPERTMHFPDLTIGGKTPRDLERALVSAEYKVGIRTREMLRSDVFTTLPDKQTISLIIARLADLGLTGNVTLAQILERAHPFGLEACPAEVGPYRRLADMYQVRGDSYYIAMEAIPDSRDNERIFRLDSREEGRSLVGASAGYLDNFPASAEFVFSPRK